MDLKWLVHRNPQMVQLVLTHSQMVTGHLRKRKKKKKNKKKHWIHLGFFKRTAAWNTTKHSLFAKTSTGLLQFCSQMMTFDNTFRRWKLSIASSLAVSHMPFPLEMQFDEWNMGTIWTFEVPLNSDHPNPVRNRPESETNTRRLSLRQTRGDPKMGRCHLFFLERLKRVGALEKAHRDTRQVLAAQTAELFRRRDARLRRWQSSRGRAANHQPL